MEENTIFNTELVENVNTENNDDIFIKSSSRVLLEDDGKSSIGTIADDEILCTGFCVKDPLDDQCGDEDYRTSNIENDCFTETNIVYDEKKDISDVTALHAAISPAQSVTYPACWCRDCGCVAPVNGSNNHEKSCEDSFALVGHSSLCEHRVVKELFSIDGSDHNDENRENDYIPLGTFMPSECINPNPTDGNHGIEKDNIECTSSSEVSVISAALTEFDGTKVVVMMQGLSEPPLNEAAFKKSEGNSSADISEDYEAPSCVFSGEEIVHFVKDGSTVHQSDLFSGTKTRIQNDLKIELKKICEDGNIVNPLLPVESENRDVTSGFSNLGKVLFERCNYVGDKNQNTVSNPDSNEGHGDPISNHSYTAHITSQLESCSLADTPLYVPETPPSPDIDQEFMKAKCSSKFIDNSEVQTATVIAPDSITVVNSPVVDSSANFIRSTPGRRRIGFCEPVSSNNTLQMIQEQDSSKCDSLNQQGESVNVERRIKSDISVASAPCSPIPQQGPASIYSSEKKRKCSSTARRRVSFPEDDRRLITSYLEPVDPWERMKISVTSEEVLAAYYKSCTDHNTAPINSVVNQITALPLNIPGRVECFSLKNHKLELSQCEGLEEILKRVQFILINLESCSLSDETMIPLLDMIEFYDSANQINISYNTGIGSRGWQACSRMIKKTQSIGVFEARETNLNDNHMPILARALKVSAKLHTLHLESCNLTGRSLVILTAALRFNENLVKLYLADNSLGSNDCIQLGNLMRSNLTLKLLDLRNNNLQDTGCAHVCEGVADQSKPTGNLGAISSTDVQSNKVDKTGLSSLVLFNNHITVNSSKYIADMIAITRSLRTLNIGKNSITNDGIIHLKESLLKNRSLKRLYLQATKVCDEGAVALAEFIAESRSIERVDLSENNSIKVAGLMALALSLRHNTSVVQLDIDTNPLLENCQELVEQHANLLKEIKDYTHRNRVQSHLDSTKCNKDSESSSNSLDPDSRKLSLKSSDVTYSLSKTSLEVPSVNSVALSSSEEFSLKGGKANDEHKKYRSPSPSPCSSPCPSPSPSPTPSPLKNRFQIHKVTDDLQSTSSGSLYYSSGLSISSTCLLSSSAPTCSASNLSTTSRPVFYQPKVTRNRFASGGRFTVTKVSDASSLPDCKLKSCSLPVITPVTTSSDSVPSSPKIVISSPVKIERGFSIDDTVSDLSDTFEGTSIKDSKPSKKSFDNQSDILNNMKSDSNESDDVFVSTTIPNNIRCIRRSKSDQGMISSVSSYPNARKDLTDSGFLEESNSEIEQAISSLRSSCNNTSSHKDSDRDSLFSNSSEVSAGLSPSVLSPDCRNVLPSPILPPEGESISKTNAPVIVRKNGLLQSKKAPLASIETGSFDTDSEDSEVTTQSSDSTHSDEVRIATTDIVPQLAWGLATNNATEESTNEKKEEIGKKVEYAENSGYDKNIGSVVPSETTDENRNSNAE